MLNIVIDSNGQHVVRPTGMRLHSASNPVVSYVFVKFRTEVVVATARRLSTENMQNLT